MTDLFCYDTDEHGQPIIDGYYWKLTFYKKDQIVDVIEGWPGEDEWRRKKFKSIVAFAERFIPKDLGGEYLDLHDPKDE